MAFAIDMITSTFCGPKNSAGDVTPRKAIHGQIHAKVRAALLAAKASPDFEVRRVRPLLLRNRARVFALEIERLAKSFSSDT